MKFGSRAKRALGVFLFAVGVLLGLSLIALATWGDFEASLFDATIAADAGLGSLACPMLIAADEVGVVRAGFKNPSDRPIEPYIRTHISRGYLTLMREVRTDLPLAPGDRQSLEWTVTDEDAAFGRLILVRVQTFRTYPLPSRRGACGILVADLVGLPGKAIVSAIVVASLLAMGAGLVLAIRTGRPLSGRERNLAAALLWLTGVVSAGLFVSLLEWWVLGFFFLLIAVLLIGAIIRDLVVSE